MIIGNCPYEDCDAPLTIEPLSGDIPLPTFRSHDCKQCKKVIWTKFDKWDPKSWTEEEFDKKFVVNDKKKTIVPK